ncbi:TonB-dependent receptor [Maribacter sp. 4U21]|uniref:TonB-dependent receptor n=1 Tax=Maribacter sp. 4U21 TaxID=1889779 RepID=UPI000C1459C0|nr:TonB-dependent receptor [Maribacter sp. 4U21]PIB28313.1 TonB-dependent receptor [Maribacter sp. 4U21]
MKAILTTLVFLITLNSAAQTVITGTVVDSKGNSIMGANVYLDGTYDGASTNADGKFSFETSASGTQNLIVSMISYETYMQAGDVSYLKDLAIVLREAINQLNGVTLTAGSFKAGDNSKVSVLKPLDIVTTAGAAGDFIGALQTLPGTSNVSEDGRLFVRGGQAGETQVFIDGLRVFQPFNATANNIPTRGRFSPFLFKGITFSTGGYSAEYGQALSSVLLLNTTDEPDQEKTDISVLSVGGGLGRTMIWDNKSLSVNAQYINLAPYQWIVPNEQGARWNKPYQSFSGETVYRSKTDKGIFKFYTGFNQANLDVDQEDINFEDFVNFRLKNSNLYANTTYKHFFDKEWTVTTGASISYDRNDIGFEANDILTSETAGHLKLKVKKTFNSKLQLNMGVEHFITDYKDDFTTPYNFILASGFKDNLSAGFAEADIFFSNKFTMKLGLRAEHSSFLDDTNIAPRVSLAYKSSEKGQFSLAYGDFYQNPLTESLKFDQSLDFEKTAHYILNYQYLSDGKTFRAEAYYKDYDGLVKFDTQFPQFNSEFNNLGKGYATGIDIFWRDNKSIKNLDYWASYSYLDTERDFRNFPERATPNFAPAHSLSLVTKYWVGDWRSQIGLSYNHGSGRPYDNPNTPEFLAEKTKSFNSLNMNWAYLISQQKILFFSVSNITGFKNINGYQYADTPNINGIFERRAIRPTADAFFVIGFFWTISDDKTSNQLDNL